MLFHVFSSQQQRRSFGGSAFVEIQRCKLPDGTSEKKLVSLNSISHWQNDSLYIHLDDLETFQRLYAPIFDCDIYGINYYPPSMIDLFIKKLHQIKPLSYEQLSAWLNEAKNYNGFYILGI